MDIAHAPHRQVTAVAFHFYTDDEIRRLSVKQITQPVLLDAANQPTAGGLYDPALGPHDRTAVCQTCGLGQTTCPGHAGHIELAATCYHPLVFQEMFKLVRMTCRYCSMFRMRRVQMATFVAKLKLLDAGLADAVARLDETLEMWSCKSPVVEQEDSIVLDETTKSSPQALQALIINRINNFVEEHLQAAKENPDSVSGPCTLLVNLRRQVVQEFMKAKTSLLCDNCRAYSPSLRQDGHAKVFEMPLPKKEQRVMEARGMVMAEQVALDKAKKLEEEEEEEPVDENSAGELSDLESDSSSEDSSSDDDEKTKKPSKSATTPMEDRQMRVNKAVAERGYKFVTPLQMRDILQRLWTMERPILDLLYGPKKASPSLAMPPRRVASDYRQFFLDVVPVPPTRFRPASVMGDSMFEHAQNVHLTLILKTNLRMAELNAIPSSQQLESLVQTWMQLQEAVNTLFDSSKAPSARGKLPPAGIKQILEKKEGLFRKHMMGKRVNYTARSVISPDVNIATSEIGVPLVFARKLTYPEPVTHHNVGQLAQCVVNGPSVHPGATHIQQEDGTLMSLERFSADERRGLANQLLTPQSSAHDDNATHNKKVLRHLRDGDIVLMNRQPTLHKPSIMAHRVRVLKAEKTLRMHYANCNTYNADFDGDEMNLHFPQNECARAEAYMIANTDRQYLVPTDGNPLRGLIQDHVVSGVLLTKRGTFLDREAYHQALFGILPETGRRWILLPPAIQRPEPLWTGKQVISTLMANLTAGAPPLTFSSKTRIPARLWGKCGGEEAQVQMLKGELLTGVLDKSQFGASAYGLVHSCYEVYGPERAGQLLTSLSLLFSKYLQTIGFTCRMDDLLLTTEGDADRKSLMKSGEHFGREVAVQYVGLEGKVHTEKDLNSGLESVLRSDERMRGLDAAMKGKMNQLTSKVIEAILPGGQLKPFPNNNMALMTMSGAKGSNVNVSQISGLLGQQELEGRRVPCMVSGKTLPSFKAFDPSARAGGYITARFLTGIPPQEYYFHCMAGREGLVDTAVKTSRSGYLQRCLIKHLEGLRVHYDQTVRDVADSSVVQFHYGEDGLDVTKQKHLYQFPFHVDNYEALLQRHRFDQSIDKMETEEAIHYSRKLMKLKKKGVSSLADPTLALFNPGVHLGAVSEKFDEALEQFLASAGSSMTSPTPDQFRACMWSKYSSSVADPGEAVGLLAAQSVGEPSTQMTLNTFHFAGFGAKNVTLGIPRLREIIMTASQKIKTPTMTLPLRENAWKQGARLARQWSKLTLLTLLKDIRVVEQLQRPSAMLPCQRLYTIELLLRDEKQDSVRRAYATTDAQLLDVVEQRFLKKLMSSIHQVLRKSSRRVDVAVSKETASSKNAAVKSDDEEDAAVDAAAQPSSSDDENDEESTRKNVDYESDSEDEETNEAVVEAAQDSTCDSSNAASPFNLRRSRILQDNARISDFRFSHNLISFDLKFDADTPKLLMLGIVEQVASHCIVHQIDQVDRCFVSPNERADDVSVTLMTEGVNLRGMWQYADFIDVDRLVTNDIYQILQVYGVEAARAALVQEIGAVFGAYGISVDTRHLSLIADYMTFEGGYKPFNRMGMDSNVSPLAKMTFETTFEYLRKAALNGDVDSLQSPSARLVMGQLVKAGTGACEMVMPLKEIVQQRR